ncbi:MAG: hypothetical protein ACOCYU_05645 [Brevefilum sp.]
MSDQENREKERQEEQKPREYHYDEKTEEKVHEKEEEKRYEKDNRDPLSSLVWALILIWAGLVFLGENLGMLDAFVADPIQIGEVTIREVGTWSLIFLGAGVLIFIEGLIRTFVPAYRSSTGGNFFLAAVLLGIGLGGLIGYSLVWPFILIAMGLAALASALIRPR